MGRSAILPVALAALKQAADLVNAVSTLPKLQTEVKPEELNYQKLYAHAAELTALLDKLDATHIRLDATEGIMVKAKGARDELLPLLAKIRTEVDALELLVDDAQWPLPKYGELLWQ
jgi:glutamine synthetase